MNTRVDYRSVTTRRTDLGADGRDERSSTNLGGSTGNSIDSMTASALDLMVRMPLQVTAAGLEWMTSGIQRLAQASSNASSRWEAGGSTNSSADRGSWTSWANPSNWPGGDGSSSSSSSRGSGDQDLGGHDLKYVLWSVVFTKPGFESIVEPLQSDLVNYSTDGASYCALKIAKAIEKARDGSESSSSAMSTESSGQDKEKGRRIANEDHRYLQCVYRVEFRMPKREMEVTRVERVVEEQGATTNVG